MVSAVLVTGGAGFIGSNFVLSWIAETGGTVVNLDKLTYVGNLENLQSLKDDPRHIFVKGDISDSELVRQAPLTASTSGRCALRGGKPCGPFYFWAAGFHHNKYKWHLSSA